MISINSTFNKEELIERYMGDIDSIKECIDIYLKSTEEKLILIKEAIESKNFEKIKFNAHSLKGVSYNISAKDMGDIAKNIEQLAKNCDIESIKKYYSILKENFLKLKKILLNTNF